MRTVKLATQTKDTITMYVSDGTTWECKEKDLINFIETNNLHRDEIYSHNELGGSDPRHDIMATVYKDPVEILDTEEYFQDICSAYYKERFRL